MFGQASNRWLSPTLLLLMVASITVHLSSGLYLAPNVDDKLHDLDMQLSLADGSLGETTEWMKCLDQHKNDSGNVGCIENARKGEFNEIDNAKCNVEFASDKCQTASFCSNCQDVTGAEDFWKRRNTTTNPDCEKWANLKPKAECSGPVSMMTIIIIVVVVVVVAIIGGVIYFLMCTGGKSGGGGGTGGKSTKSKSMKGGKSSKGKSSKSLKGKSTKSSKGGKSTKSKAK